MCIHRESNAHVHSSVKQCLSGMNSNAIRVKRMTPSDDELLAKFQKLMKIASRVKKSDVASALGISEDDLLLKLMDWGDTIPFKINGDKIVVDSVTEFTGLDQQFDTWSKVEEVKDGKLESVPEPARKQTKQEGLVSGDSGEITEENILKQMPDGKWVKISYIIKALDIKEITDARFLEVKLKSLLNQGKLERETQDGKSYYKKKLEPVAKPAARPAAKPAAKPASRPVAQEGEVPRLQELPASEQVSALSKLSKNVMPILKAYEQDFMRKSPKDLDKMLRMLEIEKSRLTVHQLSDKMLRNFIDETIKLINDVKEEQFNRMEQDYCAKVLPGILKKNEKVIKKIVSQIGPDFSDTDAAKLIVEKVIKNKSPFPPSFLLNIILKEIRDNKI